MTTPDTSPHAEDQPGVPAPEVYALRRLAEASGRYLEVDHASPERLAELRGIAFDAVTDAFELLSGGVQTAASRLQRIARAHDKRVDGHGGTWGDCTECGEQWPCPTYAWATTNRDAVIDCWNPANDEAGPEPA